MKTIHVAFCLEQQYGHILPALGIALELLRRGHRVSFAVSEAFASLISRVGARPVIICPLDTRREALSAILTKEDGSELNLTESALLKLTNLSRDRTAQSLAQLDELYVDDMPDVIIHDDIYDTAGRTFAEKKGIAKIRLQSQFIDHDDPTISPRMFDNDELVVVTVPTFFQRTPEVYSSSARFRFVGFIPEGRSAAFQPWTPKRHLSRFILASATTGMGPQIKYCQTLLDSFRSQPWDIVLSLSAFMDHTSDIDTALLKDVPANVQINRYAGNFEIMERSCLFIGQGGQGATLEAIYHGVPQIVVPPYPYHLQVARRVSELGFGTCLPLSELSPKRMVKEISSLLDDATTLERVREAGCSMRGSRGAALAAEAIETHTPK